VLSACIEFFKASVFFTPARGCIAVGHADLVGVNFLIETTPLSAFLSSGSHFSARMAFESRISNALYAGPD